MLTHTGVVHAEVSRCTSCGLCLAACPTYQLTGAEGDSPRGRLHLLDALLTRGDAGPAAAAHLSGCIECGACHPPCPTGVRVAVARRAHRAGTDAIDPPTFERRVGALAELVARDPGADLTLRAIRLLLAGDDSGPAHRGPVADGTLLLTGPLLDLATPRVAACLDAYLAVHTGATVHDPALSAALNRASGLLCDAGLAGEHDRALAEVVDIVTARGYQRLTVVVADPLSYRLVDEPLPPALRVVPAWDLLPPAHHAPGVCDHSGKHPATTCDGSAHVPDHLRAANAPVLFAPEALNTVWRLVNAKRDWLAERALLTYDARDLVRFPGARHPAETTPHGG